MATDKAKDRQLLDILTKYSALHSLPSSYIDTALKWFSPMFEQISEHHDGAGRPILVGINGCQGSGKSTLCDLLVEVLNDVFEKASIGFSIDDFYYSKQHRQHLASKIHPLLATRGVPGTHNAVLLQSVIRDLLRGEPSTVPKFNKAMDDLYPEDEWTKVDDQFDIIVLEGWCVGIDAQASSQLTNPVNAFEKSHDKDGAWRAYVNQCLQNEYREIFALLDYLVMLKAPSFDQVFKWRWEQEQRLEQKLTSTQLNADVSGLMSEQQVREFVQYYQRLTEHALSNLPQRCNSLFTLNETRGIESCRFQ